MTDTKPTPRTDAVFKDCPVGGDVVDLLLKHARTLERELAAIKSQPVPVEPDYRNKLAKEHYWENEAKRYAGNAEYWRERAEKAEAKLAAIGGVNEHSQILRHPCR